LATTQDEIKDRWNSSDNTIEDALLLAKVLYRILKEQTRNENEKIFFRIIEILFSVSYENLRRIEQIYDINLINTELPNSKHEFICLKNLNIAKFATGHYIKNFIKRIINDFSKLLLDLIDVSKFKKITSSRIQSDIIAYAEHTLSKEKIYRSYNKKGSVNSHISSIRSTYLKELQSSLDKEMYKFGHNSFVNGRNVAIVSRDHWHKKDQEIQLHYQNKTQKMELAIDDFLESARSERSLLVAAPFGSGKSTTLLNIAKHYSILHEQNENTHLPIFVYLRNGLDSIYGNLDLDDTFDLLRVKDEKILLILDALDEYPNELSNLIEKMNTKYEKYTNLKIIFSSRLAPDYPALLGFETYLRILPFNHSQVSIYLKNLFDISRKDDASSTNELILDDLSYLGLDEEEITKPLFIWLIFQIRDLISLFINRSRKWDEMNYDNPIIKLNKNEKKTIIYLFFISNIIEGKYGQLSKSDNWDIHIKEKRILRKIAFLKNLYQERLTEKVLKSYKLFVGIKAWDIEDYSKLIQAYFVLSGNKMNKVVTFLHQTFNEYLLAENYVESMVKKKYVVPYNIRKLFIDFCEYFHEWIVIIITKQ
jgi:DNA polymerase III delta prime subunit